MFENIGKKIKALAQTLCWIGIVASVIGGMAAIASGEELAFIGLIIIIAGSLISWISSFAMYGFGELIDKVTAIERNTRDEFGKSSAQSKTNYERINTLEKLCSQGLINENEYQQALSKINNNRGDFNE